MCSFIILTEFIESAVNILVELAIVLVGCGFICIYVGNLESFVYRIHLTAVFMGVDFSRLWSRRKICWSFGLLELGVNVIYVCFIWCIQSVERF